ncbi:hypothetical protein N9Y00_06980 [Tateyamaria sp.]|nr:hypothetical protein [Tateyamaria sp.]
MRTDLELLVDVDTDFGFLEGVPAVFDIEVKKYPAEPFAWGESRGTETEVSACFKSVQLNGLTLFENEATAWFGPETISKLETFVEENYCNE